MSDGVRILVEPIDGGGGELRCVCWGRGCDSGEGGLEG